MENSSLIIIKNKLGSIAYIDITISVLNSFGVGVIREKNKIKIHGGCKYCSCSYKVEGDYSGAAYFAILGFLNEIRISGLNKESIQADRQILKILKQCGANVFWKKNILYISPKIGIDSMKPMCVCVEDMPDLAPLLAVLACFCQNKFIIYGIDRLSFKESNRILSTFSLIKSLGGNIELKDSMFIIYGGEKLKGGTKIDGFNDHRIVMSAVVASCFLNNKILVSNVESVFKSYNNFFEDFKKLGGTLQLLYEKKC